MSNTVRIKRRASSGLAGAPATLENAELAYNEADNILYYGEGTGGINGSASSIVSIGGVGAFVTLGTVQTLTGNKTFTGTIVLPSTTGIGSVTSTEIGYIDGVTSAIQTQIDTKLASTTASSTYAPIASPTFTGTVSGVTATMVGLGSVDNTTDIGKPVSTAGQTALDLKANLAGPTFTGVPAAPTATALTSTTQLATTEFVTNAVTNVTLTGTANEIVVTGTVLSLASNVTIPNNLVVTGDLTVQGNTTTLNTSTLVIEDKNIVLANVATPTDITANDAGITVLGTTNKTFNWLSTTSAWTSSENLDILTGKVLKIAGVSVLSETTLGSGITESSLTSLGTITTGVWNGTTIAIANGGTGATTASGARTGLGLGTMAIQNASSVAITGGTLSAVTISNTIIDGGTF